MKECLVYYDMWQYECCGKGFDNGFKVKWLVSKASNLNTNLDIGKIDYRYEGHSSDLNKLFVLEGTVEKVKILFQKYENYNFTPVAEKLVNLDEYENDEVDLNDMKEEGFIIWLKDYVIRPATKEDLI